MPALTAPNPDKEKKRSTKKGGSFPGADLAYVKMNFPKQEDEVDVRYNRVADHCFRINYYAYAEAAGDNPFRHMKICRSLYVALKFEHGKWSHTIWDD